MEHQKVTPEESLKATKGKRRVKIGRKKKSKRKGKLSGKGKELHREWLPGSESMY